MIIIRIWDYRLLPYLPGLQLKGQWRECALIADALAKNGTPNHLLVNRVTEYPAEDFYKYCISVAREMERRGARVTQKSVDTLWNNIAKWRRTLQFQPTMFPKQYKIFDGWHNLEYLRICYANLLEKHNGIGKSRISDEEWLRLCDGYKNITGEEYKI